MVPGGRPSGPQRRVTSEPVMVPTTRLTLRMGSVASTRSPRSSAGRARPSSVVASRLRSTPWSCGMVQVRPNPRGTVGLKRMREKSRLRAFQ